MIWEQLPLIGTGKRIELVLKLQQSTWLHFVVEYSQVFEYLAADCVPVSEMAQRCYVCSAAGHQLVVPSEVMWPLGVLCPLSKTVELSV